MERMLPVRFSPKGQWEDIAKSIHPVLTDEGRNSLVLTLEPNQENN